MIVSLQLFNCYHMNNDDNAIKSNSDKNKARMWQQITFKVNVEFQLCSRWPLSDRCVATGTRITSENEEKFPHWKSKRRITKRGGFIFFSFIFFFKWPRIELVQGGNIRTDFYVGSFRNRTPRCIRRGELNNYKAI